MQLCLLDTGPIVAFLDSKESDHEPVAQFLDEFQGRFVTTSAVVVEAMHFLGQSPQGAAYLIEFLIASQTEIRECTSFEDLSSAAELMAKYADTPMDFADATLVIAAEQLNTQSVCTLDRRGFRTYRIGRKRFRLVLDE